MSSESPFCAGSMGPHRVGKEARSERIMTVSSDVQVVFRDYPLTFWLFGVTFIAPVPIGIIAGVREFLVLALVGIVIIAVASILTVTVDHRREIITLRYRSLF